LIYEQLQGRRQWGEAVVPAPPFHFCPSGCSIPMLHSKSVAISGFYPLLQNPDQQA